MHPFWILLLCGFCFAWGKPQWFPRPPPPLRGMFPDLRRPPIRLPPFDGPLAPPFGDRFKILHSGGWRHTHHRRWKEPGPFMINPIEFLRKSIPSDYDIVDEDSLSSMIQEIKGGQKSVDSSETSDIVKVLLKLLQPAKVAKKPKKPRVHIPNSIIISQIPTETTTTITQPASCTCPQPDSGIGGSPRSALPVQPAVLPAPAPLPAPLPAPVPSIPQPAPQPVPVPAPIPAPAPNPLPATPRSEIPQPVPTATSSTSSTGGALPITISQSQTTLGLSSLDQQQQQTQQPMLSVVQPQPTVALAPLLAEIKALLLAGQPTLSYGDSGYGSMVGGAGYSNLAALAPVALTQPKISLAALPLSASYGSLMPVSTTAVDTQSTDTRSSITSELVQLMNTLQQQQEQQRQQLAQQQQLQQQHQDLLEQQRSQLNQQLQQLQQPVVQQPVVQPTPNLPQPLPGQGRAVFPTDQVTQPTQGLALMPDLQAQQQTVQPQQTQQQKETTTIISVVPRTLLTLSTAEDNYGDVGVGGGSGYGAKDKVTSSASFYDFLQPLVLRKRKKLIPRKFIHSPMDPHGYGLY